MTCKMKFHDVTYGDRTIPSHEWQHTPPIPRAGEIVLDFFSRRRKVKEVQYEYNPMAFMCTITVTVGDE